MLQGLKEKQTFIITFRSTSGEVFDGKIELPGLQTLVVEAGLLFVSKLLLSRFRLLENNSLIPLVNALVPDLLILPEELVKLISLNI